MNKSIQFYITRTLLIITGVLITFYSKAQLTSFRTNDADFIEDLEKYLTPNNKKEAKDLIEAFQPVFTGKFIKEQREDIVFIANDLLKKRTKVSPDFINYIKTLKIYGSADFFTNPEFDKWMSILKELTKGRNSKKIVKFIDFSKELFENNIIYKSSSVQWKMNKGKFVFSFDKVPYVTFTEMDLQCNAKNDKSIIYETQGVFNTSTNQWIGKGGTITWERVGLPKNKTYAEIDKYKMSLRGPGFRTDSVIFHSPYFNKPILGKLSEKVVTIKDSADANFPYFTSYDQTLRIDNIFNQIDYEGAFRMKGLKVEGGAEGNKRGTLTVKNKGKAFMIIEAKNIQITPTTIAAPDSRSTVFIYGGEIISHPSVKFNYKKETDEYTLIREGNSFIKSPFESTFHQLDMHFEALFWKRGEDKINFGSLKGNTDRKAYFESKDFFSVKSYNQFQGSRTNTLYDLYKFYKQNNENAEIPAIDFAKKSKLLIDQLEPMLAKMNNMGIIYYDKGSQVIYIKERLTKYIKARSKKGDYDDIRILSEVKNGNNAHINLTNNDLNIIGIKGFPVAQNKNVKIFPKGGQIVLKKNRDIDFSGVINAGKAEFFGENLNFVYDDFKVNLPLVDSLRLRVYPMTRDVKQREVRLVSQIEQVQGTLYLDDPNNKSGNDTNMFDYPKVDVTNETYVYYDQGYIQGGAYDRNDFKFKAYPFRKDSLSYYTTRGVKFTGKLYSAGIFPVMEGDLTVQDDYSLGFRIDNVSEKIYDNRANYTNVLILNSKGLQGKGGLKYLTSSCESDDIVFFPDSLVAQAETYTNKGQSGGPNVPFLSAVGAKVIYQPKKGIWRTQSQDSLIKVFDDGITKLKGEIKLTTAGMTGEGALSFNKIEVLSYTFKLKERIVDADTCEFIVKGGDPRDPLSFQAINMNMHIDFDTRIGDFESNDGNSFLEFPDNKFMCYMNKFQWFMDSDEMGLANDKDSSGFNIKSELEIVDPNFFSTHPKQDSLGFASNAARYDLKNKILTCFNIPYIPIADARIYADSGTLMIKPNAEYVPLEKAVIVANSITKYHEFRDATVQLRTKKYYEATGTYTSSEDTTLFSDIYFDKIEPNKDQVTIAEGSVSEAVGFSISPEFKFYGKAYINASELGVTYTGKTSIVHDCRDMASGWIDFDAKVDTSNILIPLGKDFEAFTSGLMIYSEDSIGYYPSFLARKENATDHSITPATGWLGFDRATKEFQIGNKEKIKERSEPGNFVSLNTEDCSLFADGLIDFANGLGQLEVVPIGQLKFNEKNDTVLKIKASMSFNFPFNKEAMLEMGRQLNNIPADEPLDFATSKYDMIIKNKLKKKKADKAISDLNLYGKMTSFPKDLVTNFTLIDVETYWSENLKSFISKGDFAIANVGDLQIFKKCKVTMMLEKRRNGDLLHLYLEPFAGQFYYFNYKNGVLQAVSSNSRFNELVNNTKPKKATFKAKNGLPSFQFMPCSRSKPLLFLRTLEDEVGNAEEDEEEETDPFGDVEEQEEKKENNDGEDTDAGSKDDDIEEEDATEEEEEDDDEDDW